MDNYGNDMYLSHPSIDFTLLDRPSGSMISARESVAPFPQGDTSFPSFNLFDGTEAVSYNNQSMADHGSYVLETHKNVMKRHASGGFVSLPNQNEGVHDFFEQGNQPEKSDSGTWPRNEQSAYFLPRVPSADERVQRPFYQKNSYEASSHRGNSERANTEARMPHTSVGFSKSMGGEAMDHSRMMNAYFSVQKESRNQALSSQGVHNLLPSNNYGSSNSAPIKSGVSSHHPSLDNINYGVQYQKQVESSDVSSQTGVAFDHAPSYNFSGNQVPWKGAMQHPQAVASLQLQGFTRTAGPSQLQSQQQLQELFLAHHFKQLEDSRQEQVFQQAPNHFSSTSYSDLLHGPDTPPPQQQITEEFDNHASVLPSQNAGAVGLSVDGPLYYQGVVNDLQNQNLSSQTSFFKESVDSGSHLGNLKDQNGPLLASYTAGQVVPEHIDGKWKPSSHQTGKPALESFRSGSQHSTDTRTTDFRLANDWNNDLRKTNQPLANDWNNDLRKTNQPLAKLNATQYPSNELILKQNGGQVNALSQSQQHFQELQFAEQKNLSEPKQPVSSPNVSFLPQSLISAKRSSKNGMQQRSNSFTSMDNLVGYMSQNLPGIPLDFVAASGQPQWMTSSLSGSPSRHTAAEAGGRHQTNSWEGFQAPQPSRGTGFNLESAPDPKYNALGNSNPQHLSQQGSPMLGVLPGPFEAPDIRQQGLYNTQVIARMSVAGSVPNQQSSMSLHDYRKEVGGTDVSNGRVQPSAQPASQFQGAWKKYTPPMQFPPEGGSLGQQSLDGLRPQHAFQHQGYYSEASFHTPAMSNNSINSSVPYVSNQLVHEEQLPLKNSQLLEKHVSQDQTARQPTTNLMKTASRHAMKVVPDVMEENQGGSYKSVEPQDIFVERQREVPQQQVNSCTANVSLAHLRGNQSSSSLSPQHFRLGLGPSQDLQHPTDVSWRSFPNQQSLSGEVPTLKSAHKTLSTESPHMRAVSETTRKDEIELNQGSSASMKRMVLQSSGTHPSVFINRPPPVLQETVSADISPTSSFVSGHVRGGTPLVSASTNSYVNEYNTGREPTQTRDKAKEDTLSGVSQVQTSASNCASHQDAMNGFIGKSSCFSNYSRLSDYSAGTLSMQKKHLIDSSTQLDKYGSGMNVMHDRSLNNISLRQVGNRLSALDSKGLATASKASVLEHPKSIVINEQQLSGILESSRMPSSSARGVGGGDQKRETMQRAPMTSRNSNNWRGEEHSGLASSMQYTYNDQLNAYKVTQFGNEVSGLMPSTSSPNIQGERHYLSTAVDSGSSHSLQAWRPSQDSNMYQHASETKASGRNTRKPPLRAPSSSVIRPGMQPPIHEDLRQRQNFIGLEPSARVERSSESATLPLAESNKLSSNCGKDSAEPMHAGMWSTNQHAGNAQSLAAIEDPVFRLDALQKHNVSVSESKSHDISQPVATSEYSQLQKDWGKFHQTVPNTNFNHQSLTSAGFKHNNVRASEKPLILLQQSAGNKEIQVIASDNRVPLGLDSSTMKEEVVRTPIQGPVSVPKNEGQLSPLKAITPGEVAPPSKKRKKQLPLLIPWHIAVAQPSINIPSNSDAETLWATALNRVPEKDFNATHEENTSSDFRAKRRLILMTESMQRLFPPLLDGLMLRTTPAERESGIYSLAKRALEDAYRLVAKNKDQAGLAETSPSTMNRSSQGQVCGVAEDSELSKCVESFMERVRHLGMELARLDCSTSVSELQGETHELEKLSIVNRLAKHHGIGFTMDSSDSLFIENIFEFGVGARKPPAQKYVTAAPMPRTLPEGIRCLSL